MRAAEGEEQQNVSFAGPASGAARGRCLRWISVRLFVFLRAEGNIPVGV